MKLNFKIISLFLLIFILLISAVNAEDNNKTIEEAIPDENTEIIKNNNEGTFDDLQNQIWSSKANDTINLDKDFSYNNEFKSNGISFTLKEPIKSITINGNNHKLDGKHSGRIFYIVDIEQVVLKNINFVNGNTSGSGGAIFAQNSGIRLINCTFTNNKISGTTGGAVYISSNNTIIKNCLFENNQATSSGGALRINGDKSIIENNIFSYNKATEKLGGAINILGHQNTLVNNSFSNNIAGRDGGAIDIEGTKVNEKTEYTTINRNIFKNNIAPFGGAISLNSKHSILTDNQFINNTAIYSADEKANCGLGGAVRINGYTNTNENSIKNNNFINNTAYRAGGAIYIEDSGTTISRNNFNNNQADNGAGGSLNLKGDNANIVNNTIIKTYSKNSGGAIYIEGKNTTISKNNIINAKTDASGGALFISGANAILNENVLNKNSAGTLGGAIFIKSLNGIISNNTIDSNTAKTSGGALYSEGTGLNILKNNFTNNNAGSTNVGGAIRHYGNNSEITHNLFENNTAKTGTAIYGSGIKATINNNQFINSKNEKLVLNWENKDAKKNDNNFTAEDNKILISSILTIPSKSYVITTQNKIITGTLKDINGKILIDKEILFKINNQEYATKTDENGIASISITLNVAKTYDIIGSFKGDESIKPTTNNSKIKIIKEKTKATISKKTFKKSLKNKKLSLTLKTSKNKVLKNKKIVFTINKKKYTGKTNSKGIATVKIKLNKKGKYKYTAKFAGDSYYTPIIKTSSIKIK